MASNQTQHLQLCQWEAEDEVLRVDFNADNAKIDAAVAAAEGRITAEKAALEGKLAAAKTALEGQITAAAAQLQQSKADKAGLAEYTAGSFTGDGSADGQVIQLGFTPDAVIVWPQAGAAVSGSYPVQIHACMALNGLSSVGEYNGNDRTLLEVVGGGFKAYRDGVFVGPNANDTVYFYLAFHR